MNQKNCETLVDGSLEFLTLQLGMSHCSRSWRSAVVAKNSREYVEGGDTERNLSPHTSPACKSCEY